MAKRKQTYSSYGNLRAAIYARVSTDGSGQDPLNQLLQLRAFASTQSSWQIVAEYVDRASGKNGDRAQFQAMMQDANRRKFDVLLFWSLDRLTREGTWKTLCYLRQLTDAGVRYKSYTEQYIDSLGLFGEAVVGVLGAIAQQERLRISERTKAGMARARAAGRHIGRPSKPCDLAQACRLRDQGLSYATISRKMKVSRALLQRRLGISGRGQRSGTK